MAKKKKSLTRRLITYCVASALFGSGAGGLTFPELPVIGPAMQSVVQSVLGSSSKVMVDVKGGNNLLYLPLDRMSQGAPAAATGAAVGDAPLLGDQMQSLRNDSRIRGREGR